MPKLFDYVDAHGRNPFKEWSCNLEKRELAKLNRKLDLLQRHGNELPPGLLSNTSLAHILKIRINGEVAIRPLLCRGPINMATDVEFTLLMGVYEKDRKLPPSALDAAELIRQEIGKNPQRRKEHERVSWRNSGRA